MGKDLPKPVRSFPRRTTGPASPAGLGRWIIASHDMPTVTPSQWSRRLLSMVQWAVVVATGSLWAFVAINIRSPFLRGSRDNLLPWFIGSGLAAIGWWLLRPPFRRRFRKSDLVTLAVLSGGAVAAAISWRHQHHRREVAALAPDRVPEIGTHLMAGWLGLEETMMLAGKGAIAGVFLTNGDSPGGSSVEQIRAMVDTLQQCRRDAGLPRLWIATDQEGGPVEKLSPPVPKLPPLGKLVEQADADHDEIIRTVARYAESQASVLAELGVNMNLAPVVDLRPSRKPDRFDLYSRIDRRAVSADPQVVSLVGETYVRVFAEHGITCVLKHFPGLGRIPEDTHFFPARCDVSARTLEGSDWIPFRSIAATTSAGMMLGHVRVTSLDPEYPASCSSAIAHDLLRQRWGVRNLLVTDDFSMAPIYHGPGGIRGAARRSLAAGVDLILVSYDAEAVYDILAGEIE